MSTDPENDGSGDDGHHGDDRSENGSEHQQQQQQRQQQQPRVDPPNGDDGKVSGDDADASDANQDTDLKKADMNTEQEGHLTKLTTGYERHNWPTDPAHSLHHSWTSIARHGDERHLQPVWPRKPEDYTRWLRTEIEQVAQQNDIAVEEVRFKQVRLRRRSMAGSEDDALLDLYVNTAKLQYRKLPAAEKRKIVNMHFSFSFSVSSMHKDDATKAVIDDNCHHKDEYPKLHCDTCTQHVMRIEMNITSQTTCRCADGQRDVHLDECRGVRSR